MSWPCAPHARPRCKKHGTILKKNDLGEYICWFGGHLAEVLLPPCCDPDDHCRRTTPCAEKKKMGDDIDPYALVEGCAAVKERFG